MIVPEFGAFVSLYEPAYFDMETCSFRAPRRLLGFNNAVAHNDGMLAASIARREGISYDRAVEAVRSCVEEWKMILARKGSLTFDAIGSVHTDSEGTWIFEPETSDSAANYRFTGLPELSFGNRIVDQSPSVVMPVPRTLHRWSAGLARVAASVAVIVTILAAMLTFMVSPESPLYYASFFPAHTSVESAILTDRPITHPAGSELRLAMRPVNETYTSHRLSETEHLTEPSIETSDHYYLIVASLASQNEVDRYLASLPDNQSSIMDVIHGNGRFRVYAASGSSVDEMNSIRNENSFKSLYPDAWIYKCP